MSYLQEVRPPKREDRLNACVAYGGSICGLAGRKKNCWLQDGERTFSQTSNCMLLLTMGILNTLGDTVVLIHGPVGCGSPAQTAISAVRIGSAARWGQPKDVLWLSTALDEVDVIRGAEDKLEKAIIEIDQRYSPKNLAILSTCIPGIIGDDIDAVAARAQPQVKARLLPAHCEGFKPKVFAVAYDTAFHTLGRNVLPIPEGWVPNGAPVPLKSPNGNKSVNLFNVGSMGRVDEVELSRLLTAIGLEVNIFPMYARTDQFEKLTGAALSVSICPTHDDYMLSYLEEAFGVPYQNEIMPIGINNTSNWLRKIANHFGLEAEAENVIAAEERELRAALAPFLPTLRDKTVFITAGEYRTLATATMLLELGLKIAGLRLFHHDGFADTEYEKIIELAGPDVPLNIANSQPFEEANLLKKIKPDIFLGHPAGNSTAAKLGIPTHIIFHIAQIYLGYGGVYGLVRRIQRTLKNPSLNQHISQYVRLPYKEDWYQQNPYTYISNSEEATINA